MKKPKLIITLFILVAAVFISENAISKLTNFTTTNRAGDPVGPGVTTVRDCTGCHTGVPTVSNDASRVFTFGTGDTAYTPGAVYTVKFKMFSATPVGFSATVLRNDSNIMAGVITPADTAETKVFLHVASGRSYLNHRVGDVTNNEKEYSFTWTAPAAGTGPVTFYFSSLTSNNDQDQGLDTTYLNSYVVKEFTTPVGLASVAASESFTVYPNPANERIHVGFMNTVSGNTEVTLYSMDGKRAFTLLNENLSAGLQDLSFDLSGKTPGIYFIKVSNAGMNSIQKVYIH